MLRIHDWREHFPSDSAIIKELPRSSTSVDFVMPRVKSLMDEIHRYGEQAVKGHIEKFDGVKVSSLKVPSHCIVEALERLEPTLRLALETSIARVRQVALADMPQSHTVEVVPGGRISTRYQPIERVAIYAPGGKAVYPSSVIMAAVPAQIAGVKQLTLFSPPQQETGLPSQKVLAAAALLGISDVYSVGGVDAVYMATYGLPHTTMIPHHLIVGPGNIYVTAAKRLVSGNIGIDSEAGPTEVMILADETASPRLVASDLISQAEHDENAACLCITTSYRQATEIAHAVTQQAASQLNRNRIISALSGTQSAITVVKDSEQMIKVANAWGAEHLSLQVEKPQEMASQISNAGAIFIGAHSPVSLGDYLAGSNHVLPTGNTSLFKSGLSVHSFLRHQEIIDYSEEALAKSKKLVEIFAEAEGLPAHGSAVTSRFVAPDRG